MKLWFSVFLLLPEPLSRETFFMQRPVVVPRVPSVTWKQAKETPGV